MNDEDAELLNWLELKDFKDGYKLYDTEHTPKLATINHPEYVYQEIKAYVRINKASKEEPRRLPTSLYC